MTFGDHQYGAVDDDGEETDSDEDEEQQVPLDHPMSEGQCDHPNCKNKTPEYGQRICDDCIIVMNPDNADRCPYCGATI